MCIIYVRASKHEWLNITEINYTSNVDCVRLSDLERKKKGGMEEVKEGGKKGRNRGSLPPITFLLRYLLVL